MTFELSVVSNNDLGSDSMACGKANVGKCTIVYRKQQTPVIYYLQPPVVYYESFSEIWFDPKYTTQLITDLSSDEMPFINTKIGGSLMDFELDITAETTFTSYSRNKARGQVGELPISGAFNLTMQWETGQALVLTQEATHCSYDNSTCYQAKSVPVIFSTSANSGYKTGGMNLTVTGYGFASGEIEATVDGQECVVSGYQTYSFSCEVQPKSEVSVSNSSYVGSNGLRWKFINETTTPNWDTYDVYNFTESLALSMQNPFSYGDSHGSTYKGWFVAPATTNYRFYITCDENCKLSLGNTTGDAENTTVIAQNYGATGYRTWWNTNSVSARISEWVSLTQGEHYYMEAQHQARSGGDHFSAAVEIEHTAMVGHHHSMKEVQYVSAYGLQQYEVTRITVKNSDSGSYLLVFTNPNDLSSTRSLAISAKASADQLRAAV